MAKRKIIKIDEEKCNGCGICIPNCPEGALQIIDGKARLVSDLFCDGLGACIGHCPQDAISIEEREAGEYSEEKVIGNMIKYGPNVIAAHLKHLEEHGASGYIKEAAAYLRKKHIDIPDEDPAGKHGHMGHSCPGSRVMDVKKDSRGGHKIGSELANWPVQITLVPVDAPYFKGADILIAADCVPFAYADFHRDMLKGKILLVGCPKLDDSAFYQEKITQILRNNDIRSVTCLHMEVPCCFGLVNIAKSAVAASGKAIPFEDVTIGIKGDKKR